MAKSRVRKVKGSRPKSAQQGRQSRERRLERVAQAAPALSELGAYRRRLDEARADAAVEVALQRLPELLALTESRTADQFEDSLCMYLGSWMHAAEFDEDEPESYLDPDHILAGVIAAAAEAVRAAGRGGESADTAHGPWLLLDTLGRIATSRHGAAVREAVERLRRRRGGESAGAQPQPSTAPMVPAGPALWARDAYGSRFAVTVPFTRRDGVRHWYLWDVDACSRWTQSVFSGYFDDADAALSVWKAHVGPVAADGSSLGPADDPDLLSELLPVDPGELRVGGESAQQMAEYHRGVRLAQDVRAAMPPQSAESARPQTAEPLDAARCVGLFTAWHAEQHPDGARSADFGEAVEVLAHDWIEGYLPAVQRTCSPHRVAHFAEHLAGFYREDFAERLLALLPDWVAWFSGYISLPAHLAERCAPYAAGRPHPAREPEHIDMNPLACVEE